MPLKIISFFVVAIVLFIMAIIMSRQKKQMTPIEREKVSQGPLPWWYYIACIPGAILVLGQLNDTLRIVGIVWMTTIMLIGWNWKRKHN